MDLEYNSQVAVGSPQLHLHSQIRKLLCQAGVIHFMLEFLQVAQIVGLNSGGSCHIRGSLVVEILGVMERERESCSADERVDV